MKNFVKRVFPRQNFLHAAQAKESAFLQKSENLRAALLEEASTLLVPDPLFRPEKMGDFYFYQKIKESGDRIFCRVPASALAKKEEEDELLSFHEIARNFSNCKFADVAACKISENSETLGFVADISGAENFIFSARDFRLKSFYPWKIENIRNFEFFKTPGPRGEIRGVFTVVDPETRRPEKVHFGEFDRYQFSLSPEPLVSAHAANAYLDLSRSKDSRFVFISSNTRESSQVWAVDAEAGGAAVQVAGAADREVFCEARGEFLYIFEKAASLKIFRQKIGETEKSIFFTAENFTVSDADMFESALVLYGWDFSGNSKIISLKFIGDEIAEAFETPEKNSPLQGGRIGIGINNDFKATHANLEFSSPLNPGVSLRFCLATNRMAATASREFQRGKNFENYRMQKFSVGEFEIPLTVFSPKKLKNPGPCLVHVYGACGEILEPQFAMETAALLSRGWVVAYAHVRGGGERGEKWQVKRKEKISSLLDFKECCDFLISEKFTSREKLCGFAVSSGGAILAAAINQWGRDLLGGAAVLRVPFLDILGALENPETPLALLERAEWGDPEIPEDAEFLRNFSPAENIREEPGFYPPMLVTAATGDSRVPFEGTLKFAEAMENAGHQDFVFRAIEGCGHGTVSDDFGHAACEVAFLLGSVNS